MQGRSTIVTMLAAALVLLGVPQAGAASSPCTDEADATVQGYHLNITEGGDVQLWEETNDVDGLQTEACQTSDGQEVEPDSHVTTLPPGVPSPPEIPDPPSVTICIPYTYICLTPL